MWRLVLASSFVCFVLAGLPFVLLSEEEKEMDRIETVVVEITFSGGEILPAVHDELHAAITEVAELALITQLEGDIQMVLESLDEISDTLKRVIDLTLQRRGFAVDSLVISPARETLIEITLAVSGEVLLDVILDIELANPEALPLMLFDEAARELTSTLRRRFLGLPISDRRWILSLFEEALSEEIGGLEDFAHFDYRSEVIPAPFTRVILYLTAKAGVPVIERHTLRTRSSTLLNVSVDRLKEIALVELSSLDGLPVEIVLKNTDKIESHIEKSVRTSSITDFFGIEPRVTISVRDDVLISQMIVESSRYRVAVEGRVDFDREENNPRIEVTLGFKSFSFTEVYALVKFFPDVLDIEPEAGFGFNPDPSLFLGAGWDFDRETLKLRGDLWLGTYVHLAAEYFPSREFNDDSEYRAVYQVTDVFSVSVVADGEGDVWLAMGVRL